MTIIEDKILIRGLTFGGVNYGDVVSYKEYKALAKELEATKQVVEQFSYLMNESDGVAGLHLNGDIADWDWLLGEWLDKYETLDQLNKVKK